MQSKLNVATTEEKCNRTARDVFKKMREEEKVRHLYT